MCRLLAAFVLVACLIFSTAANAIFFFIPIPNLSKPPALQTLIDALEKSEETKAVALVSEDKTFGRKYYVWGHHAGRVTQAEADRIAMSQCEAALARAKGMKAGGKELYDYGNKKCELYSFANQTLLLPAAEPAASSPAGSPQRADSTDDAAKEVEAKKKSAEEEAKRLAVEEDSKRLAAEAAAKAATEEQAQRVVSEEQAKQGKLDQLKRPETPASSAKQAVALKQIDFNAEANKASRILGCQPLELKVTGVEAGNVQYLATCHDSKTLSLSCDPSGLCLRKGPEARVKR